MYNKNSPVPNNSTKREKMNTLKVKNKATKKVSFIQYTPLLQEYNKNNPVLNNRTRTEQKNVSKVKSKK